MSVRSNHCLVLVAVVALLSLAAGIVSGATVTQNITYQGKLTDAAGTPLTGTYSATFKLYDVASGGTALSTDTHSVTATNGLFTTTISVTNPAIVDGRALWLGIKVGADPEMTPRQEVRPVPYALGLRPGAWITSSGSDTLNLVNTGYASVLNISQTGGYYPGVKLSTTGSSSPGVQIITMNNYSHGVFASTSGDNSHGVHASTSGTGSYGVSATTSGDASRGVFAYTSGDDSPAVFGDSRHDTGVYGIGKTGGFFTTNQAGTGYGDLLRPGVDVSTAYRFNPGVRISTTGDYSDGVRASTAGSGSFGVFAVTGGTNSKGVWAVTNGDNSEGVDAATNGDNSKGVYAVTTGANSPAIYGSSGQDVGVYGRGKTGGFFTTNQGGTDWWTDRRPAINVSTVYQFNPGMYVDTLQTNSPGVYAYTHGDNSQGFAATTSGSGSPGLNVYTAGPDSKGVDATSAQSYGLYGHTGRSDQKYGIYTPDYLYAKGTQVPAADVAEYMPVTENVTPGTVLVIGEDGKLRTSATAYDTGIAGIVSTAPGVTLGTKEGGNPGEQIIAVAGRVPCKADTSNGPIHPRDLLTTSRNPGYAMKATNPQVGTVLGKAMGTLESGTGTIEVLVTLQ